MGSGDQPKKSKGGKQNEKKGTQKDYKLTNEDKAILKAAKQKPLWVEEDRVRFTREDLLAEFIKETEIDFSLFDPDYMAVYEVFS